MKILFLTHYFEPDVSSNAVIATELAKQLVLLGNQVTVISSVPHYDKQEILPEYKRIFVKQTKDMHGKLRIWHTWVYIPRNKRSTLQRFLSYFSYNALSTLLAPFVGKHDVILTMSPPLSNGIVAYAISKLMNAPYIYNIQDLFPDLPIELGLIKNQKLIAFLYKLEKFVYDKATAITLLTEGMQKKVLKKRISEAKLETIPNFVDTKFISPHNKRNTWACQHNFDDKFVVMYTGNIGTVQNVAVLVDAAYLLQDNEKIHIAIVGDGAAKEDLIQKARQLNLRNITFLPLQPRENIPDLFASADLLLVSLCKGVAEHSVPSKTYTIMASGRPILASVVKNNAVYDIVEKANCGFHIPPEDPQALANVVRQLVDNPDLLKQKGLNGYRYVLENYSADKIAKQYNNLLNRIVTR